MSQVQLSTTLFRRLAAPSRLVAGWIRAWYVPILLGSLPLIWLLPSGTLLLGQDSYAYFIHPFNAVSSPLIPYNLLGSYPFSFQADQTYLTAGAWLIQQSGLGPSAAEILTLWGASVLGTLGFFALTKRTLALQLGSKNSYLPLLLATGLYVFNPYSLSVVWWHYLSWTLAYFCVPWIVLVELEVIYSDRLSWRVLAAASGVLVLLDSGTFGPYFAAFVMSIAIAFLFILASLYRGTYSARSVGIRFAALLLVTASTLWSNLAFAWNSGVAASTPQSLYLGSSISQSGLVSGLIGTSINSSLLNVLSLTGYLRLAATYGPLYYAWYSSYPIIGIAAVCFPAVVIAAVLLGHRHRGTLFLAILGLVMVPLAEGSSPPFGSINTALLVSNSSFSVLLGGYYYFIGFYVVTGATLSGVLLSRLGNRESGASPTGGRSEIAGAIGGRGVIRARRRRFALAARASRPLYGLSIAVVATVISASAIPFIVGESVPNHGPNAVQVAVPPSFQQLAKFLSINYTGPIYNVLVLPMSAIGAYYYNFNGAEYISTSHLLSRYVDYPVLNSNAGALTLSLEDLFAAGSIKNLRAVFASLHIKYVVINPFVNASAWFMQDDPQGNPINWGALEASLFQEIGPPSRAGSFEVYTLHGVAPIIYATARPPFAYDVSFADYLAAIGATNPASVPDAWSLDNYVWTNSTSPSNASAIWQAIGEWGSTSIQSCNGCYGWLEEANGSIVNATAALNQGFGGYLNRSGSVITGIHPHSLFGSGNYSEASSNMNSSGGVWSYRNQSVGYLELPALSSSSSPIQVGLELNYSSFSANRNVVLLTIASGSVKVEAGISQDFLSGGCSLIFSAFYSNQIYAINNTGFPFGCGTSHLSLSIVISNQTVSGRLIAQTATTVSRLSGGIGIVSSNVAQDGYHNISIAPAVTNLQASPEVNLTAAGPIVRISNVTAESAPPFSHFVSILPSGPATLPAAVPAATSVGFRMTLLSLAPGKYYVVLFEPSSDLWSASAGSLYADLAEGTAIYSVWVLQTSLQSPAQSVVVQIHFLSAQTLAIGVSVAELVACALVWALPPLWCRRRKRRKRA